MILNVFILFKYCTEMKMPLPDGHLGFMPRPYSQSYPQNLWVSNFLISGNGLKAYAEVLSRIDPQASEPA
jgi:hypothetical protein